MKRLTVLSLFCVALAVGAVSFAADEKADDAKKPPAAKPAKPARKPRTLADTYPLPYPPTLPDGQTVITDKSAKFLEPSETLRPGVKVATTPPEVDFMYYPLQNYPGHPWSHRSDGFVKGDKFYSSSNDHLAPRGTAHLWEYDDTTKKFRLLCDTSKFLESIGAFPESMDYRPGEMQSRVDMGSDGWLYYFTDRGSPTVSNDAHGWLGEWLLRTNPTTGETQLVQAYPVEKHTIPACIIDPERMVLYFGTAPGKDAPNQKIQFVAYDLKHKKILKQADDGPYRVLIFAKSTGCVFWKGHKYDPATNEITPANVPDVRSCTVETPQGIVYGTSTHHSADIWAYHVKTDKLEPVREGGVGKSEYVASIDADPTGRYLYYIPGAHGGAHKDGAPVVQYDLKTNTRKVLAFLRNVVFDKYGYELYGSFGSALDEKGERLFISWDGFRKDQPRSMQESAAMTVVRIPASERPLD